MLYNHYFHFNNGLQQLYMSNKMEHFSCKGECDIFVCTHIEELKEELAWVIDEQLQIINKL